MMWEGVGMATHQITSVLLTEDIKRELQTAAKALDRSMGWCVRQAVSKWLREDCGGLSRQASDG
jgi:predicted transcriptional regulator